MTNTVTPDDDSLAALLKAWLDRQDDLIYAVERTNADGHGPITLDVRTAACIVSLIRAAERRRQAEDRMIALNNIIDMMEWRPEMIHAKDELREAKIAVNAALTALEAHLRGDARGQHGLAS
jgi:hypothetical protein